MNELIIVNRRHLTARTPGLLRLAWLFCDPQVMRQVAGQILVAIIGYQDYVFGHSANNFAIAIESIKLYAQHHSRLDYGLVIPP